MNERDAEAPFPREPWQRLLEDSADVPPQTTDARIRTAARRALAPRGHRWWLPASLAASFALAVLIVHSQFGTMRRAPMAESDRTGGAAMDARLIDRNEGPEARTAGDSPAAAQARAARPAREAPLTADYGYLDPETASDAAGVGPRIGGPERDLKAASELPQEISAGPAAPPAAAAAAPGAERDLGEAVVSGGRTRADGPEARTPATAVSAHGVLRRDAAPEGAALATPPTPEAWYAAIEKLRAEGRLEEAGRELERLEKAYPGWLEKHLEERTPR